MSVVGAYIDLPKGESAPRHGLGCWVEGELNFTGPEGLDVTWRGVCPEGAQVYIEWTPRVYAVWEEDGVGDVEDADGVDVEQRGEEVPAGSDFGA